MDLVLWIVQAILAIVFAGVGYSHSLGYGRTSMRPGMGWLAAVGPRNMAIIGVLEVLGAVGLVLPAATGILPWLTPLAAIALAVLMLLAAIFHARRPGETANIALNVVLGLLAVFVAYGRIVLEPLPLRAGP